jgi:hypothetical protein
MNVTVIFNIPEQRIADLMVTAIEGGSNHWCSSVRWVSDQPKPVGEHIWYSRPEVYAADHMKLAIDEIIGGRTVETYIVTREGFEKAFRLMAENHPSHFADFLADNEDAETADVFLQLLALGEIVYG